jgi:hypothetical protein
VEGAAAHRAAGNDLVGGAVAVLGHVDSIGGRGAVVLGDFVVLAAPEDDDAVGILLDAAGLAQVGKQRTLLPSLFSPRCGRVPLGCSGQGMAAAFQAARQRSL